jgi:hypothetical protein
MIMLLAISMMIVVLGAALWVWTSRAEGGRARRFSSRNDVDVETLHAASYGNSNVSKAQLEEGLKEIASTLGVPMLKLRPSDRFKVELAAEAGWEADDGLNVLTTLAERRLARKDGSPIPVEKIETVDDYIRIVMSSS